MFDPVRLVILSGLRRLLTYRRISFIVRDYAELAHISTQYDSFRTIKGQASIPNYHFAQPLKSRISDAIKICTELRGVNGRILIRNRRVLPERSPHQLLDHVAGGTDSTFVSARAAGEPKCPSGYLGVADFSFLYRSCFRRTGRVHRPYATGKHGKIHVLLSFSVHTCT